MAKIEVWDANWVDAWGSKSFDRATGSWVPIGGTMLISNFGCIGRVDFLECGLGRVTFIAGEIKTKTQCGFELVLGTLIVCCIYVLANLMYLAVVPLQDIATLQLIV
jgi:APA family basic amino acid/polyamine antiporter